MIFLVDDCIYCILQHLQNDRSTLFNCLFVNRFWCKSTIPLLYANPFGIPRNYLIISTLIFCFNKAEILQMKKQLRPGQINNFNLDKEYKPLFQYSKYWRYYDYILLNSLIDKWYKGCCTDLSRSQRIEIRLIFHHSILRQSKIIENLNNFLYLPLFYKEDFKSFNIQNFTSNLTKLKSLSLNIFLNNTIINEFEQEFLSNIMNINLRELKLRFPQFRKSHDISNKLITLKKLYTTIQEQNNLLIFMTWHCDSLLNDILRSLEFQKHSLVHIEIITNDFSNVNLKGFNNLYNLEYLVFEGCKGLSINQCKVLKFASFKLKKLSLSNNNWNDDVTILIIKYLGASLQRLSVKDPPINLIKNMSMYCPNLIFLKLIYNHQFAHLNYLLGVSRAIPFFKNLRIRTLYIDNYDKNLSKNIPINVNKITIDIKGPSYFSGFKEFLKNCHNCFEIINLTQAFELKFLKIGLNYIERSNNNNLKIFGMAFMKDRLDRLNDEESKLLNQIKAKGVKIMHYEDVINEFFSIY